MSQGDQKDFFLFPARDKGHSFIPLDLSSVSAGALFFICGIGFSMYCLHERKGDPIVSLSYIYRAFTTELYHFYQPINATSVNKFPESIDSSSSIEESDTT